MDIERRISLRDIRVLLAVARAGSMGRAAASLATSQSAISRSIAALEATLGVRLLDRSTTGVEPTPYGLALVQRGIAVFDELAQGLKDLQFLSDPMAGELRIGASIAVAVSFLAPVIDRLARRHPRLTFDVLATDTTTAYRALRDREVELVVAHLIGPIDPSLMDADILMQDPHVVIAGAGHPAVRRRRVALSDLMDEPWILPPADSPYGAVVEEAFRAAGLVLPRTVVRSTLPLRAALLEGGRFLSMVPRIVVGSPRRDRALVALPVALPTTTRPLGIVTLKNRTINPSARTFADHARAIARKAEAASRPTGSRSTARGSRQR
jgi:DNA-binding transcriptional LysR family regulator